MQYEKDFDTILQEKLTDITNQPTVDGKPWDVSQGSVLFTRAVAAASAEWGLYKYLSYIGKQISATTGARETLDRAAYCLGMPTIPGETTEALRARILARMRRPPAGGNKYDYEDWAAEVDGVAYAHCIPTPQGAGTVDVVVIADGADEVPSAGLLAAVYAHIDAQRPVTAGTFRVLAPQVVVQNLVMPLVGLADTAALDLNIAAAMKALKPGKTLVLAQLAALALKAGATDAGFTTPAGNLPATEYQVIRCGTIAH